MNEKLKDFSEKVRAINTLVSRDDFVKAFEQLLKIVLKVEENQIKKIDKKLNEVRDGEDGYTPRKGIDYFDGKLGDKGETGPPGESIVGPPGEPGKDGSPDTSEDIRNKLELLEDDERLKIDAIKDLREELDELKRLRGGKMMGVPYSAATGGGIVKAHDLSANLDGTTKTFNLPAFWRVISVHLSSFPNILRPTIYFTTDASLMQLTFTDEIDAPTSLAAGQSALIVYAEP